jgi:AcrR family transcriptional regulator
VNRVGLGTPPERRTQAQRRAATRAALVRATVDCLVELGYARTTTQEVQLRAGVSRGALTHHFRSKAELVLAAVSHLYDESCAGVRDAVAALPDDPALRVRLGIELLWEQFRGPLFAATMELWMAARTDPELREALLPHERRLGQQMRVLTAEVFGWPADHPSADAMIRMLHTSMRGQAMTYALQPEAGRTGPHVQHWQELAEAFGPPVTAAETAL